MIIYKRADNHIKLICYPKKNLNIFFELKVQFIYRERVVFFERKHDDLIDQKERVKVAQW